MKKLISLILCLIMTLSLAVIGTSVSAQTSDYPDYIKDNSLYAHAVTDEAETESWLNWQNADAYIDYDDEDLEELGLVKGEGVSKEKYFFLPSNVRNKVVILNTYSSDVTVAGTVIPAGSSKEVTFEANKVYTVAVDGKEQQLIFKTSSAEASIFINNTDADGKGTDLFSYLCEDKENGAKATGAIVDNEGNVDNTPIKKIKGRGNTTWLKNKKPFNVTYDSAVSVSGMQKTKKLSLLANYQDSALIRNRFLQDLSDEIGMPYASDSRFVDVYMNGAYLGSYQLTQKVDIGKNNLVPEIDDDTHLNDDGTLKSEFPFICEVDASAGDADYYIRTSSARCKLTLKGPELEDGDPYYNEVLQFAKTKFDAMYDSVRTNSAAMKNLVDIDSLTKIMLINELGKNWDVGVSSLYFVYKQDADGNWKFFASPVWDYDNSLGNCTGVAGDLRRMGVTDYEEPTGWWVKYKPGADTSRKSSKYTILGYAAQNSTIMDYAAQVWFEEFVPALELFNSENVDAGELYSKDVYYNYLKGSADMNYTMGWLMTTGDWICDHSELLTGTFDAKTGTFTAAKEITKYDITSFEDQYRYTVDWLNTRAAWLSAQFFASYEPSEPETAAIVGDADMNSIINVKDATLIQKHVASITTLTDTALDCADADRNGDVNVKDATTVQKFVAGITITAPVNKPLEK